MLFDNTMLIRKNSMIVVVVVAGFCVILGLHRLKNHYLPFLSLPKFISNPTSKYITSPALIGNRHLKRLPGNLGYIPSRSLSLLIICYVALNAALCAINYPTQVPDTWFISTSKQRISWISNRLGVLCFANIALTIMFSGRNTPLSWITGADRSDILTFHRWASRVAAAQAIGHVVLYWTNTSESGEGMFTLAANIHVVNFDSSYWAFGIGAVVAMGFLVVVFSILPMRIKFYETFLFLHILLAMGTLIGLWYHVVLRFNKAYGYETWLYIAFAFWGFDRVARPIRIVALNWKSWFLKDYPSATVELLPGDEFVKVTMFPSLTWNFTAGQHCYLYFPSLGLNPFQSHPFSIVSWSGNRRLRNGEPIFVASPSYEQQIMELRTLSPTQRRQDQDHATLAHHSRPTISFIMRPEQGLTRSVHTRLLRNRSDRISPPIPVCLEGPYGTGPPVSLANADTILAIAGGIGITSIISYLQLYLETLRGPTHAGEPRRRGGARASRFVLVWSAREESLVKAIRSQIGDGPELGRKGVEIRIVDTSVAGGERLDVDEVVRGEVLGEENEGRKVAVVVCGPGGMADAVRGAVVGCIGKGDVEVELVEESFCW
jgi:predicted ferric reductase